MYKALYTTRVYRLHEVKYICTNTFLQTERHSPNYTLDKNVHVDTKI